MNDKSAGTVYSIIPARGGSKGVPKKNILPLNEKPLIAYSIKASLNSNIITRTIVSTDSKEIAAIAKDYGAEVPFLRPNNISDDRSTDYEFFKHAIEWFETEEGKSPDYFVHLRPTTPLRDPKVIDSAIELILSSDNVTSLRSVHEMSESAYKCLEIENGFLKTMGAGSFSLDEANDPRQGFPTTYIANGYIDIIKTSFVKEKKLIHGKKVIPFLTSFSYEVDTIDDFSLLEYLVHKKGKEFELLFGEKQNA